MGGDEIVPLVGRIYRKCAAFFSEIDDMIIMESLEHVENQLMIAGANAKEACSKVVEGILPEFLTDSLRVTSPLENKENCEVAVSESLKSEQGDELVEIVRSSSSAAVEDNQASQAVHDILNSVEDNQASQTVHDVVDTKDINVEAPCVSLVDDSCSVTQRKKTSTSDLLEQCNAQSREVMETEEKCECVVLMSEVHNATDCPGRKHQLKHVHKEESELQDEDFCESESHDEDFCESESQDDDFCESDFCESESQDDDFCESDWVIV